MLTETALYLDWRIKRIALEKSFPVLTFEYFRYSEHHQDFVRVRRRGDARYFDEVVYLETFPTDEFITRCALIA